MCFAIPVVFCFLLSSKKEREKHRQEKTIHKERKRESILCSIIHIKADRCNRRISRKRSSAEMADTRTEYEELHKNLHERPLAHGAGQDSEDLQQNTQDTKTKTTKVAKGHC